MRKAGTVVVFGMSQIRIPTWTRLICTSDWTNVRRTFDAAKLRYEVEGFLVDAFVSHPVIIWNEHFNESDGQDWFSGIYASTTKPIPWQDSEFYFLARNTSTGSPQFYGPPPDQIGRAH